MSYVAGADRSQSCFLPASVEDYVDTDAPARVIDAFVEGLDFAALGFAHARPGSFGRPSYDPRDLLKLYIYGYLNEVRSSRRLERECKRNLEVMWLVRQLVPDHKTIADFRRNNGEAIVGACRAFVFLCREQGLFTAQLVAIDGSKFRAVASPKKITDQPRIAEAIELIDAQIADYLTGLDKADAAEPADAENATKQAIEALKYRREELKKLSTHLQDTGHRFVVEGELDARPMGYGPGRPPSYNVQSAVDAETGFIIHHDVTDETNDTRALYPMAKAVKTLLGQEKLTVVADAGYSNGAGAGACEADGITACAPTVRAGNSQGDGTLFDRTAFAYDKERDCYICPAGRVLPCKSKTPQQGLIPYVSQDCSGCAFKQRCTPAKNRSVNRHVHEEALQRMNARATPEMMRSRRCSVEHPFGTIKRMTAGGRFLTRGLEGTFTEMSLSILAYNLLRSINLRACPV